MNYPTIEVPKEIAHVISMYRKRAEQEKLPEAYVIYWILDHIQFGDYDKADEEWIHNHMVELAIAVRTGVYATEEQRPEFKMEYLCEWVDVDK